MKPAIFRLALRSLHGDARRSGLTVAAIGAGLGALIFLWAFNDGLHRNMLANFQDTLVGSLQIHRSGFFDNPELSRHIADEAAIVEALQAAGARTWTRRLETYALAASHTATEGSFLIAMDPLREPLVTRIHEKVSVGRFLRPEDDYTCVLGATAARNLGVKPGDEVTLVAYDRYGVMSAENFRLVGIITSGEMGIDSGLVLAPLASVQATLDMEGRVTDFPVKLPATQLDRVTEMLRAQLAGQDLEVLRWHDMFPVMHEWVTLHNGFLYLFLGIVLIIVLAGVLNTVLLSMIERVREFGVFMALGYRHSEVRLLVLSESLLIGMAGSLAGTAFGIALVAVTARYGIDMSAIVGATERFYVDPVIFPVLNLNHLGATVAAVLFATAAAGLYPAWRAGRLEPAEAIRHV